jgi:tripartite-type tricarboxylate transporter receptor subunit TctC
MSSLDSRAIFGVLRLFALAALAAVAPAAFAQADYPSRPIRFIVPYPPGGANDTVARMLATKVSEGMGQPVIVDNKPGASGMVAGDFVAKAEPDGYTVMIDQSSIVMNPALHPRMAFDIRRDLAPVTLAANMVHLFVVNPSVPAKDLRELAALARARPGAMNYSSPGSGSPQHVAMELFNRLDGIQTTHVAYKGGAPAMLAVVTNEVQMMLITVSTGLPQVTAGKAKALAVLGPARVKSLPDVPTMRELGIQGLPTPWLGIFAPGKTPPAVVARLNAEFVKALQAPDMKTKLQDIGFEPIGSSPEEFVTFLRNEYQVYGRVIREAGIQSE